jgi:predicted RNA binding protein YcfA (HicA-like mRNA interferase family)
MWYNILKRGVEMTAREIEKIITQDGWFFERKKGSHKQYHHPKKKGIVTIPIHSGDIPKGTLNAIFKQAGLK